MSKIAHIGSKLTNNSVIVGPGVPTVRVNGQIVSVLGDKVSDFDIMVTASPTVRAGGKGIVRFGDIDSSNHLVNQLVSPNVSANGS